VWSKQHGGMDPIPFRIRDRYLRKKKTDDRLQYVWYIHWVNWFYRLSYWRFFVPAVMTRPYFLLHPKDVSVYEGQNVTFYCGAAGFPSPVIGWLKNNVSIGSFSSVGGNSSLVLRLVESKATNGIYKCVARNSLGKTFSSEATLTVLSRQTATRGKTIP